MLTQAETDAMSAMKLEAAIVRAAQRLTESLTIADGNWDNSLDQLMDAVHAFNKEVGS